MSKKNGDKHILSILVENQPGVLSRISGLFSGRGFNIESLCVAKTIDPEYSRITLVTRGDMAIVEQIKKQLNKLINVLKVTEFAGTDFVERVMVLIKVRTKSEQRAEILRLVEIFRARVVDAHPDVFTIEVTGDEGKIIAFIDLVKPMGIKEIVRTGAVAMAREKKEKK